MYLSFYETRTNKCNSACSWTLFTILYATGSYIIRTSCVHVCFYKLIYILCYCIDCSMSYEQIYKQKVKCSLICISTRLSLSSTLVESLFASRANVRHHVLRARLGVVLLQHPRVFTIDRNHHTPRGPFVIEVVHRHTETRHFNERLLKEYTIKYVQVKRLF